MGCLPGLNESHLPGLFPHGMDGNSSASVGGVEIIFLLLGWLASRGYESHLPSLFPHGMDGDDGASVRV